MDVARIRPCVHDPHGSEEGEPFTNHAAVCKYEDLPRGDRRLEAAPPEIEDGCEDGSLRVCGEVSEFLLARVSCVECVTYTRTTPNVEFERRLDSTLAGTVAMADRMSLLLAAMLVSSAAAIETGNRKVIRCFWGKCSVIHGPWKKCVPNEQCDGSELRCERQCILEHTGKNVLGTL
ncbi:hypothetical protein HPB52_003389 [Rhipicephalus sanguineus]|uniref:Uncharacterized protein n=1 Tax=Rhipicephalus sanguineus TaxID=34632 RepID=A0A9D4PU11_RHISA|nr:hypothetical protein HPB52_003389 [Rhipicephalus sanguineus]